MSKIYINKGQNMARQVLDHGVIIPAEYSDDWYEDMSTNLNKLDEVIGSDADKLSEADVSEVALSGDYDDLTNKPNYGILRMTSETLSDSGSGAISNLNSDSKLAAGDYVLDAALKVFPITAVSAPSYTVGTSLFQITNASALAAVATSGSYDDLNNIPTYGITRFVNTAISDNSSVAFSAISSTDKIKVGDFLLDTVGKMYQISSVDTANETVSVTTPLTQLAVDSFVIHKTGNETKSGDLTLNDTLNTSNIIPNSNNTYDYGTVSNLLKNLYAYHALFRGQQQGDEYSPNARTNLTLLANRDTIGQSGCFIDKFRENTSQGTGSHILGIGMKENSIRYGGCRFSWLYDDDNNGYVFALRPTTQGANQPIKYELGNSSSKWNTINGLNPGALSFPDLSNGIDISGYVDVTQTSQYTAPVNGYISICGYATSTNAILIKDHDYDFAMTARAMTTSLGATTYLTIPVVKSHVYDITCGAVTTIEYAKFFPCLGNV